VKPQIALLVGKIRSPRLPWRAILTDTRTASVAAAHDPDAYADMVRAVRAADKRGIARLVAGHKVLLLASGANVLVLARGRGDASALCRVRVLEGEHQGTEVWVAAVQLQRADATPPRRSAAAPCRNRKLAEGHTL
jgi:hypothetical protein